VKIRLLCCICFRCTCGTRERNRHY